MALAYIGDTAFARWRVFFEQSLRYSLRKAASRRGLPHAVQDAVAFEQVLMHGLQPEAENVVAAGASEGMVVGMNCPSCQRVIYDRRLPRCGYCGAAIPKGLRFTEERIAEIDLEMAELKAQEIERKRVAERERQLREADGSMPYLGGDMLG